MATIDVIITSFTKKNNVFAFDDGKLTDDLCCYETQEESTRGDDDDDNDDDGDYDCALAA